MLLSSSASDLLLFVRTKQTEELYFIATSLLVQHKITASDINYSSLWVLLKQILVDSSILYLHKEFCCDKR